jgi:hypothetical protein
MLDADSNSVCGGIFEANSDRLVCTAITSEYSLSAAANVSRLMARLSAASVPSG